jgi:hypothetical protein
MVVNGDTGTSDGCAVSSGDVGDDDPLAAAYDWAEYLWDDGVAVPPPAFAVGQTVVTRACGQDAEVRSRRFIAGTWLYEVRLDGRSQRLVESALDEVPDTGEPTDWVLGVPSSVERFGATLTRGKLVTSLTDTVFSFRATRRAFRPYQFKPVLRLLHTGTTRILIADEVGLGKTIEAGLIWTKARGAARSRSGTRHLAVLVGGEVAGGKWQEEMAEHLDFTLIELDSLDDAPRDAVRQPSTATPATSSGCGRPQHAAGPRRQPLKVERRCAYTRAPEGSYPRRDGRDADGPACGTGAVSSPKHRQGLDSGGTPSGSSRSPLVGVR